MKIRIVTDTAADLPHEFIDRNNIEMIELPVTFEGENSSCKSQSEFWKKLISGKAAYTSQPNPHKFGELFSRAKEEGDALICILLSSKLSGTYESAVAINSEADYEHIYLFDSLNATMGEGLLVTEACALRDKGCSPEQIMVGLNELRRRIRVYACIDTLKYLARGGRISKASAGVGSLLNVKPLISVTDGNVLTYGKAIGLKNAMKRLVEQIASEQIDSNYPLILLYAYDDKNCLEFLSRASEANINVDMNLRAPIGATIGTHIGPGGFGIVYVVK